MSVQVGTTLIFGVADPAYGYFETIDITESTETTEAMNGDGDIKSASFHGKKKEVTGTFVFISTTGSPSEQVGTGTAINFVNAGDSDFPITGEDVYITEVKQSYKKGEFKAIDFTGVIYPDLGS